MARIAFSRRSLGFVVISCDVTMHLKVCCRMSFRNVHLHHTSPTTTEEKVSHSLQAALSPFKAVTKTEQKPSCGEISGVRE
jgi:hypothetical protein